MRQPAHGPPFRRAGRRPGRRAGRRSGRRSGRPLRGPLATAALLLLCALFAAACGRSAPGERWNVLLISLDSTRRDMLGVYGRRLPGAPELSPTPEIDALAADGVVFEDAYATSSWTLPSHVSIFTGEPELVHAVDFDSHRPDPSVPMLAERLRAQGYRTAGFFSGPYLEPHFGFDRGFDRYEACYGEALRAASRRLAAAEAELARARERGDAEALALAEEERRAANGALQALSHRDVSSEDVTGAALDELERAAAAGRPFFLFAHYFDPHYDYTPPAPYDTRFDASYEGPVDGTDFLDDPALSRPAPSGFERRIRTCSERDLEHVFALYAGELAWTDAAVGRVLAKLAELGLAERTLVIVTSDHGDEFLEHGYLGHRLNLLEESVRVPLVMRAPGVLPAGRRVPGLVSTVDLAPTVLSLAGARAEGFSTSRSLLPLVRGDARDGERGLFGRLARSYPAMLHVPGDEGRGVPGELFAITETYREGTIKVTRERRWTWTGARLPAATLARLRAESQKLFETERLRWIDLAAHPDEAEAAHVRSFDDPRARAVLQRFHDRYAELARRRGTAQIGEQDEALAAQLSALGYGDGAGAASAGARLPELPPPGAALLR